MGTHYHLASNHFDGEHANNPYRVVYTPEDDADFQLVEGAMHSEYATVASAREILADERWQSHLERADCLWLRPYLERIAAGEEVSAADLLTARDLASAARWADRTAGVSREDERAWAAAVDVPPHPEAVSEIRRTLREALTEPDATNWPRCRLACVRLFAHGDPADALLIWRVRDAAPGLAGGIETELCCGAGLEATLAALREASAPDAADAVAALERLAEESTVFDEWTPAAYRRFWGRYYGLDERPEV
ncbi:hypothetical protein [Natronobiforma cellulositropha]|uniref:hypothetical protein n=1 Tax=Natronobiforma cellulositropha TaxID=1679076 RepID=UPI0021D5E822|nr:hypothetical protein [Natronobiforma cellulositropha]